MHPSNIVLYSSGVLHLCTSPRETGIKNGERDRERKRDPGHPFTEIPNKILFSNRAPSQWSGGKVETFFVGDCLYNFLQL